MAERLISAQHRTIEETDLVWDKLSTRTLLSYLLMNTYGYVLDGSPRIAEQALGVKRQL